MPFKSKAQQGFMFAKHPKLAKEFEEATPPGTQLPEHVAKMDKGGEVPEKTWLEKLAEKTSHSSIFGADLRDSEAAENVDPPKVAAAPKPPEEPVKMAGGGDPSAQALALQQLAQQGSLMGQPQGVMDATGQAMTNAFNPNTVMGPTSAAAQGLAQGVGNVVSDPGSIDFANQALGTNLSQTPAPQPQPTTDPAFMAKLQAGTTGINQDAAQPAPTPSLQQTSQRLAQTPATNYDFYKNISADDRAKLYQSLTQKQNSGGQLAASALGGLGDAISNSFGKGGASYQKDIMARAQAQKEGAVGAVDTQRAQKMQDMQANIALQEADPKSPYSEGMRQFLTQITGKPTPSGMSGAMLKGIFPDYVKIFESKAIAASAAGLQGVESGKALMGESGWQRFINYVAPNKAVNTGSAYLEKRVGGTGTPDTGGWSVKH